MLVKNSQQLILFVRSPEPGKCKTRLIPLLGRTATTELYKKLVKHSLKQLSSLHNIDIALYVYPDTEHEFIQELRKTFDISILPQAGADLGERMHNAVNESLKHYQQCVLIGSDCPEIDANYIDSAFSALKNNDLVFGPASDGGYVLIGNSSLTPEVFRNIAWSTDQVLQQSLHISHTMGYRHQLLKTLWDIDNPDDYIQHHQRIRELFMKSIKDGESYGSPTG